MSKRFEEEGFTPDMMPEEPKLGDLVVSEQIVMESAAGFYVGTACLEYCEVGACEGESPMWFPMPYSRDSEYFATKEEAQRYLES